MKPLNTINDLIDKFGNVNTAIIKSDKFKTSSLYYEILNNTSNLNIFKNIKISDRIKFLYNKLSLQYCPVCNKPYIKFKKCNKIYRLCNHNFSNSINIKNSANNRIKILKKKLEELLIEHENLLLSVDVFNNTLNTLCNKLPNYQYSLSKSLLYFYHDLIIKTSQVFSYSIDNLELSKRVYYAANNILDNDSIPVCKVCNTNKLDYINNVVGFSEVCSNCKPIVNKNKTDLNRFAKYSDKIYNKVNLDKYEILSIPVKLNYDDLLIKCKSCGEISNISLKNGFLKYLDHNTLLCKNCEYLGVSQQEQDLIDFIKSIYGNYNVIKHDRHVISPMELDLYLPDIKLAIEYDGLYWHASNKKPKNYHLEKTDLCEQQGIQLIHIFEDEWRFKHDIVKNRLKNLLGHYSKIIYARKCIVKEISSKDCCDFQELYHIQGSVKAPINLGLYYKDELIAIMNFSKSRFNKNYEYELLRYCSKEDYHVIGGAGKLLKYFERTYKPTSLVSYADRRWSKGNLYSKLGFKCINVSTPNYWYFNNGTCNRESRLKFQKHKLAKLFPDTFNPSLTEEENMKLAGYDRIYDCGNLVFVKEF